MFSFPHVAPDLGICLRGWGFHVKPVFFFIIFSGDLYFDAMIIVFFEICVFMGRTLGEGAL